MISEECLHEDKKLSAQNCSHGAFFNQVPVIYKLKIHYANNEIHSSFIARKKNIHIDIETLHAKKEHII